tara:strand:+ start:223 stop:630 length:408 start_codon:yes stop_codon:yes gene_type:complete
MSKMALLTREQILGADDLPKEVLDIPEWGGQIMIRTMSGSERDAFEASLLGEGGKKDKQKMMLDIRARFASLIVVDSDGKRLFTAKDIKELGKKSASALDRVLTAGQKLSGLTSDDVEELAKNSESDLLEDSTSG